jgi:hypothetical protein
VSNPGYPSALAEGVEYPPPGPNEITLADALSLEARGLGRVVFRDGVGYWQAAEEEEVAA